MILFEMKANKKMEKSEWNSFAVAMRIVYELCVLCHFVNI